MFIRCGRFATAVKKYKFTVVFEHIPTTSISRFSNLMPFFTHRDLREIWCRIHHKSADLAVSSLSYEFCNLRDYESDGRIILYCFLREKLGVQSSQAQIVRRFRANSGAHGKFTRTPAREHRARPTSLPCTQAVLVVKSAWARELAWNLQTSSAWVHRALCVTF